MELIIEKNIPFTRRADFRNKKYVKIFEALEQMNDGDSFLLTAEMMSVYTEKSLRNIITVIRAKLREFKSEYTATSKVLNDNTVRVWKVALKAEDADRQ